MIRCHTPDSEKNHAPLAQWGCLHSQAGPQFVRGLHDGRYSAGLILSAVRPVRFKSPLFVLNFSSVTAWNLMAKVNAVTRR